MRIATRDARLASDGWRSLAEEFRALQERMAARLGGALGEPGDEPLECSYGPVYEDNDDEPGTICLLGERAHWTIAGGSLTTREAFITLASMAATTLGKTSTGNWISWLDHLRASWPEAIHTTTSSGSGGGSSHYDSWPASHRAIYPREPWRTAAHYDHLGRLGWRERRPSLLDCCIQECERQRADALRRERAAGTIDDWLEIADVCETWRRKPRPISVTIAVVLPQSGPFDVWHLLTDDDEEREAFARLAVRAAQMHDPRGAEHWLSTGSGVSVWLQHMHERAIANTFWPPTLFVSDTSAHARPRLRARRWIDRGSDRFQAIDDAWRLFALCARARVREAGGYAPEPPESRATVVPPVEPSAPSVSPSIAYPDRPSAALGVALKSARKRAGYSQEAFAEACGQRLGVASGLSVSTVRSWEHGVRPPPPEKHLAILDTLNAGLAKKGLSPMTWAALEPETAVV